MILKNQINKLLSTFNNQIIDSIEDTKILQGKALFESLKLSNYESINQYEFKVFSQWGDDGIIQFLIHNINLANKTFAEFGVQDYLESNTRFLLMNNNWSGLVFDGSEQFINKIKGYNWYWKYDLTAESHFISKDNINELLNRKELHNLGLLHIDIDGVDYWIWDAIKLDNLNPSIVVIEYNSLFGKERSITVPYDSKFIRSNYHYSNLFYGASLKALINLSESKGYCFIGSNFSGNNAYFVRKDLINDRIRKVSINEGYYKAKFRESRNTNNELTYLNFENRIKLLKGLEVFNTETNKLEIF